MILADRMKQLRIENHLTQKQVADRLGIQKSTVSYYELGDRLPSYDVLIKFAKLFNVTTDYLLGIDTRRSIDVSDLSESDVNVLVTVANALKRK